MNWSISILLAFFATGSVSEASIFTGSLKTKHGKAIAFCKLTAQPVTGSNVQFESDRSGNFSAELGAGQWTLSADVEQIQAWGFSQMVGVSILITGEMNVYKELILFASEPLQAPSLGFTRPDSRTWKFSVNGQGGTIVKIYSSTDMLTWTPYNTVAIGTTGVTISSSTDSHKYITRIFFKATASTE
jgi:hypothetical protein